MLRTIMNKKETQDLVTRLLAGGNSKTATFNQLAGQGVSDGYIASLIASHADPKLCERHGRLIKAVLIIAYVQMVITTLLGFAIGLKTNLTTGLISASAMAAFMYMFVWGFKRNKVWAYNVTILLAIIQLPNQLKEFSQAPIATTVWVLIAVAIFAFIWHVRKKLFPDFAFLAPRKVDGSYVFTN